MIGQGGIELRVFFVGKRAIGKAVVLCCSLALILISGIITWNSRSDVVSQTEMVLSALEPVYHGSSARKEIALTCNVDWGEEFLPDMLQLFQQKNVKVTFFVTGRFADKFPELVRQMAAAGHEIGNHGYEHFHPDQASREENAAEIKKAEKSLLRAAGTVGRYYAPPYGESSLPVLQGAADCGYKTILWSLDTVDWQRPDPETIKNRVLNNVKNGDIILMHPTEQTLAALPDIIGQLQKDGFRLVTVDELLAPEQGRKDKDGIAGEGKEKKQGK